jgi:ribonuclease VapC
MVIDSSAIAAIFFAEPERDGFLAQIEQAESRLISAVTVVEVGIVLETRLGDTGARELDLFLQAFHLEIVPVDAKLSEAARSAWRQFGKGRHPAALNLGDCFAYALAHVTGEPLLAKGGDFSRTNIPLCAAPSE